MNRRRNLPAGCPYRPDRRRGTLFHYYMVYMLLTGTVLTLAGLSLHAILRADYQDSRVARQLANLLQLQQAIRTDVLEADTAELNQNQLLLSLPDDQQRTWSVDENFVHRRHSESGEAAGSERYVFSAGTEIAFSIDEQQQWLTIRIRDPAFAVKQKSVSVAENSVQEAQPAAATDATGQDSAQTGPDPLRQVVEILVRLPAAGAEQ